MGLSLSHGTPHERTHETCRSRGTCSVPLDTTHELENVPRVLSWGVPWDEFSLMARPIDVHMTVPMGVFYPMGRSWDQRKVNMSAGDTITQTQLANENGTRRRCADDIPGRIGGMAQRTTSSSRERGIDGQGHGARFLTGPETLSALKLAAVTRAK